MRTRQLSSILFVGALAFALLGLGLQSHLSVGVTLVLLLAGMITNAVGQDLTDIQKRLEKK